MEKVCCLCGKKFIEWGNNPWPLFIDEDGEAVCCSDCNMKVIVARIELMRKGNENEQ